MSRRAPNELESKLHQAALSSPKNELTAKQVEEIIPDASSRQQALNFLLGVGLFKLLQDKNKKVSFRAVAKTELVATKDLSGEENLVLSHIKSSHNEGIWTKHLKAKTNLHQTVIDRCLKTLTQKRLIKRVPSVQYPTRKLYMLEGLEPSVALTGGPWYTDNELDTEFIDTLIKACFKFIRDSSFPKRRSHSSSRNEDAIYPISNAPHYPNAQQVRNALRQARLTETELSVEHVEMLLNVLVLDGEVEKIPSFGPAMWDPNILKDGQSDDDSDRDSKPKKKKRRKHKQSDTESENERKSPQKKRRRKKATDDDDESEEESISRKHKRRRKSRGKSDDDSSSSESDDSSSDEDRKSRSRSRSSKKRTPKKRSASPIEFNFEEQESDGGFIYKAIKQERMSLGWSQAPCSRCPSFEFCKHGGPVNPRDCIYFGDWLVGGTVAEIEDV